MARLSYSDSDSHLAAGPMVSGSRRDILCLQAEVVDLAFVGVTLEMGLRYFDPFTKLLDSKRDDRTHDGRPYIKEYGRNREYYRQTEAFTEYDSEGKVLYGCRHDEDGGWTRYRIIPRRQGRTLKWYRLYARQNGFDFEHDPSPYPGARYSCAAWMRVTKNRVVITQSGGLDI